MGKNAPMTCSRCLHDADLHGVVCSGAIDCLCTGYQTVVEEVKQEADEFVKAAFTGGVWKKKGWDYKKTVGGSQQDVVKLYILMGKTTDEIQKLLHCKRSSIRGRRSELKSAGLIPS